MVPDLVVESGDRLWLEMGEKTSKTFRKMKRGCGDGSVRCLSDAFPRRKKAPGRKPIRGSAAVVL